MRAFPAATSFSTRIPTSLGVVVAAVVALTGCGSAVTDDDNAESAGGAESTAENQTAYPLTVESCGVTQTFDGPPERAVTLTSTATETLLELGLEDKMVGTAYQRNRPIGEQYETAYDKIAILSPEQPSMEQLLSVDPDFVYAGYPDGFSESTGHTRQQLQELGILTHLSPVGCTDEPKTLEDETDEIATMGQIFNVNDAAAESIEKYNTTVDAVLDKVDGLERPKVWLYNSGSDAPTTVGGWAYASAMMDAAGGENIFADEPLRWGKVSWEQVAAGAPDIIVIYDYLEPSVESKIATLKSIPAIADVPAIKNDAFVVISLSLAQPGPRSAEGIEVLAKGFHPDEFEGE